MKRTILIFITLAALFTFGTILYRSFFYAPTDEIPVDPSDISSTAIKSTSTTDIPITSYPSRLSIPKINVDANIQKVGITAKGNMATPNNFTDVGWYKYGALPGVMGSAVIAGHVNNGLNFPAVFSKLGDLSAGDDVYVTTENGTMLHFKVTGSKVYDFNQKVDEVFKQNDNKFLKLITCTGTWVPKYKTHDKRLVVSAMLVE
ncbi:MAG TPA: class F sortase [Candidatus Paceibacterota bacterium]|jgi:LPXTG-site transpeptidase (sortase) family protein|nr:class F sortase [Candidatus Paceibacterota bacterium]